MRQLHNLKIEIKYADKVISGLKTFEVRNNDRKYKEGDLVVFELVGKRYNHDPGFWIENRVYQITYITNYEQKEGWVVFGIKELK